MTVMNKPDSSAGDERPSYRSEPVSEILADMTGRTNAEFDPEGDYEYPSLDELESVPADER